MKFSYRIFLICFVSLATAAPAQHVIATIPLGDPGSVAVNSKTNRIYVTGFDTEYEFSVIDGETNQVSTTQFFDFLGGIVVCPICDRVFVGGSNEFGSYFALEFDGAGNLLTSDHLRFPFGPPAAALGRTRWIYTLDNRANTVYAMDGENQLKIVVRIPVTSPIMEAADGTGQRIYVIGADENLNYSIVVIDTLTNAVVNTLPIGSNFNLSGMAVDGPRNLLYLATTPPHALKSTISVYDATTGSLLGTTEPVGLVRQLIAMPGTGRAALSGGARDDKGVWHDVKFIDGTSFTVVHTLNVGKFPGGLAYNPVTKRFYVAVSGNNAVSVIGY
jgi:DNA-binding beta-propeller fold protein YncE